MDRPDWAPEGVDIDRPNPARAYDYLLGGSHNFAVDREAARRAMEIMPDVTMQAQANRAFLHRAVRFLVASGIRQFLDLGSGIPTVGNVHEVVQREAPEAMVVYVDVEPVAVAHSRQLLAGNDRATAIQQDIRRPDAVLGHREVRAMLDLTQPIAVLMVALLHYVPDADDPHGIVARYASASVPGSYLAITHPTPEDRPEWVALAATSKHGANPVEPRSRPGVAAFFAGYDLVEPGLVWAPQWRPERPEHVGDHPERTSLITGVGRRA